MIICVTDIDCIRWKVNGSLLMCISVRLKDDGAYAYVQGVIPCYRWSGGGQLEWLALDRALRFHPDSIYIV